MQLTEVPSPLASQVNVITEWPARQLCFPNILFSRISGFASHLFRWFAFSRNFFSQWSRPLRLNESDPPAVQNIGAGDGQGLLNAGIEQNGCQDLAGVIQAEITWKEF